MMLIVRSACFYGGYILSLLIFGLASIPLVLLPQKIAAPIILLWNRFVLFWLQLCCGIRYKISGNVDNIPRPCVVIANHQSPWETIFFQQYFYPLTTVLKHELLRIPFFGWGMRILRPIAIDRSNPIQALKQIKNTGVERLAEGQSVLIFPEGTRQPADQRGHFARSGADIAKAANVPIIAIAHDAGRYWLNKKLLKQPGVINVTIGEAITVGDSNTKEVMKNIQQWVDDTV